MQDEPQPLTPQETQLDILETTTELRMAKSQVMSIRLSDIELRVIAEAARRSNVSVGSFLKRAALDAAELRRFEPAATIEFGLSGTGFAYQGRNTARPSVSASEGVSVRSSDIGERAEVA